MAVIVNSAKKSKQRSRKCCFCGKNSYAEIYCAECEESKRNGANIFVKRCCYCGRAVFRKQRLFVYSPGLYCCVTRGSKRKCVAKLSNLM